MKKVLQLIRPFRETRNIVALCLAFFLCAGSLWAQTTETLNIANYASANNWTNSTQYLTAEVGVVTFTATGGGNTGKYYSNDQTWRFYANESATLTISVPSGYSLVSVTPTYTVKDNGTLLYDGSTISSGDEVSVSGDEVVFTVGQSSGNKGKIFFTEIVVAYTSGGSSIPFITASNIDLDYDAASGEIEYVINNPANNGVLTASTTTEWISDVTVISTAAIVTFNTTTNVLAASRQGIVTLTYTYGNDVVTKNVTVTQAGNPNAVDNISDITSAGTYTVQGTIVAKSQRGFIVGDGTGYVYYYNQNYTQADYNIGDIVKLAGAVSVYGGVYEFTSSATITSAETSNYVAEEPLVLTGADMAARVASTTPPALSTYVQYQGTLSVNGTYYNITNIEGAETAKGSISFPINTDFTSLNGRTVIVEGYFVGVSSSQYYNTMLGSITEVVSTEPSITVELTTIEATAETTNGSISVTYNNMETIDAEIVWYEENGETETVYDWITAEIDANNGVYYEIEANDGEARTAYFKVSANGVYSELITVTQEGYVAPTVATLPFEFDGTVSDINDGIDGLTQEGLGNYTNSPHLKFDGTGDWLMLHFDGVPGKLSYTIKGNNFSGGTFTVQTSEDGVTFEDLETYTEFGNGNATLNEEFLTLGENVRYIKWIYTNKASGTGLGGNVALGNIVLEEPSTEPVITLAPVEVEVSAEATTGTLTMSYVNMGEDPLFTVQFFAEDGETYASDNWISASVNDEMNVSYPIEANDGETRTAYLKVYGLTDEYEEAYSNLVTITQAAAQQQYELTISAFENLEIFTFVDNLNELALEGAGTIPVTEGASVSLSVSANEGYVLSSLVVDGQSVLSQLDETGLYTFVMPSHAVTVTATAELDIPGEWVLTSIEDLTEDDVFVIVGTRTDEAYGGNYAMTNDNGTGAAPAAVSVTVVGNTLSGTVPSNIQWNISFSDQGFTFYPNGNTDNWLYSTNTNNGVRVGDNNANVFTIDDSTGYIKHVATSRYLGVYQAQDWRTYTTIHANIANETFAFYKKVTSNNTQTIDMATGTNWVSFYVETNLDDLKAALVAATPNSAITIQDQNNNTKYNPSNHRWTGRLTTMDVAYMYKITVASGCEITLEGMPINPADHPVTINLGATWIAFPLSESMTLANAFAGFAVAGDKVQSQNNNASYNGTRWSGRLTTLEPGKGYVYQSAQAGSRTLTFPSASKRKMK